MIRDTSGQALGFPGGNHDNGAMANITLHNDPVTTVGELPTLGSAAPDFTLVGVDLAPITKASFVGKRVILSIFPSLDTGVCATSTRKFNEAAAALDNTVVVTVSKDLPFAAARFCTNEGIENVVTGSAFNSSFGDDYGVTFTSGPLTGLLSRAVVVLDENGIVIHSEQVPETTQEPDYDAALTVLA